MHRIRAVTLDLDDTLWAIDPVIRRAEERLWAWLTEHFPKIPENYPAEAMLTIREEVVDEYWHKNHDFRFLRKKVLERVATSVGYDVSMVEPAFAVFDAARNDVELFPDVLPNLELLARSLRIVAVTNGNANLEIIGIRHLFHDVVTAVGAGAAKPARRIFEEAVDRAGVAPQQVLHVGDHPETDVAGAREAGLRAAWINRKGDDWPDHLESPEAVVTSMTELHRLLGPAMAASADEQD